jgi:DNA-binding Lrp family transcriptional regulator
MDKDILKILENDAKISVREMAIMVGKSPSTIFRQVKQAERERIILKYKTVINWDRVEDEQVWALIDVRVKPQKDVGFDAIAEQISQYPPVRSLYLASGDYDLVVIVIGKSEHEIADFVSQKLVHVEGVQGTETHFILKRYKEDGVILRDEELVKRQAMVL